MEMSGDAMGSIFYKISMGIFLKIGLNIFAGYGGQLFLSMSVHVSRRTSIPSKSSGYWIEVRVARCQSAATAALRKSNHLSELFDWVETLQK